MQALTIEARKSSPFIQIDPLQRSITINGMSSDENSLELYKKVISYMDDCSANSNSIIHAEINFKYFNTSSAKCILDILERISREQDNGSNVKITWFYEDDDDEMLDAIRNYSEILEVDIDAKATKDD